MISWFYYYYLSNYNHYVTLDSILLILIIWQKAMGCETSASDSPMYSQHPPPTVMDTTNIKEDTKTLVINAI